MCHAVEVQRLSEVQKIPQVMLHANRFEPISPEVDFQARLSKHDYTYTDLLALEQHARDMCHDQRSGLRAFRTSTLP